VTGAARNAAPRKPALKRRSLWARVRRVSGWLIALGLIALLTLQVYFLACVAWWSLVDPSSTSFMREQRTVLRARNPKAELAHRWVDYNAISNHLKRAVITAEDAKFSAHGGVDWPAIEQAFQNNLQGRRIKGGSTITQQLAKNLFLSGERSYLRKSQELVITYMIEMFMSKRRILEIYLNVVEWGNGVFGAEAAARHYYGVGASQLTAAQSARLAAMLPRPRFFDRNRASGYLAQRAEAIQRYMHGAELP